MRPTFAAIVLAGSLLASPAGQPALWDQLWSVVSSLWNADADAGLVFDPNGCSTGDAGPRFDPDGSSSDAGIGFDPNG